MRIDFTKDQLDLVISALVRSIAQVEEAPGTDPVLDLVARLRAEKERLMRAREAAY